MKKVELCKTDALAIIFELEKANEIYKGIRTMRASNRQWRINYLLNKLKDKLS